MTPKKTPTLCACGQPTLTPGKSKGGSTRCVACRRLRANQLLSQRPGYHRDRWLRREHGITLEDYEQQLACQDGLCPLCDDVITRGHWDHDHRTGLGRAVLCYRCNVGLGSFRDNAVALRRGAAYVEQHRAYH